MEKTKTDRKVRIEIIENNKVVASSTINCDTIKDVKYYHNESVLDKSYYILLEEIAGR